MYQRIVMFFPTNTGKRFQTFRTASDLLFLYTRQRAAGSVRIVNNVWMLTPFEASQEGIGPQMKRHH